MTRKPVESLKEDAQGFRILAKKNVPPSEGFKNPRTKLSICTTVSKTDLQETSNVSNSRFYNSTMNKANADVYICPKSAMWIYYVGKFVCFVVPESIWQSFFDKLLKMMPQKDAKTDVVHLVVDNKYIEDSTKREQERSGEKAMPSITDELHLALSNTIMKKWMYPLFVNYLKSGDAPLIYPTIINNEGNTWIIKPSSGNTT